MKTLLALLLIIPSLSWGEKIEIYLDCKEKMPITKKSGQDHWLFAYDVKINTSKPNKSTVYYYWFSEYGDSEEELTFLNNDRINYYFRGKIRDDGHLFGDPKIPDDWYEETSINIKTFHVTVRMKSYPDGRQFDNGKRYTEANCRKIR